MDKKQIEKRKQFVIQIGLILFMTALVAVIVIHYIRNGTRELMSGKLPQRKMNPVITQKWVEYVSKGNKKHALLTAKQIVDDNYTTLPDIDFFRVLGNHKLPTTLLTSPFSTYDYRDWKNSSNGKLLVNAIKPKGGVTPGDIFKKCIQYFKANKKGKKTYDFNIPDSWNTPKELRHYTTSDKLYFFASLVRQINGTSRIVGAIFPDNKGAYLIAEVAYKNKFYTFDFVTKSSWECSASELSHSPRKWNRFWKEKGIGEALQKQRIYMQFFHVQDLKRHNRLLHKQLSIFGKETVPCFGLNPRKELEKYIPKTKESNTFYTYWEYPLEKLAQKIKSK